MKSLMIACCMLLMCVCGCGGSNSATPVVQAQAHTPVISNLSYSPKTAALNSGGGQIAVDLSFNFYDLGGDGNQVNMNVQDATTYATVNTVHQPFNTNGLTSGTINYTVIVDTTSKQNSIFNLHVNDASGNYSLPLQGTFSVVEPPVVSIPTPTVFTPPVISNMQITPTTLSRAASGNLSFTINGTVILNDDNPALITRYIDVEVYEPWGSICGYAYSSIGSSDTGRVIDNLTVPFQINGTIALPGIYSIKAYVQNYDLSRMTSNTLIGTFTVTQ